MLGNVKDTVNIPVNKTSYTQEVCSIVGRSILRMQLW